MNLKTRYRTAVSDLRLRIADIAPVLSRPGSLIRTPGSDGADAVIRLGAPERPALGYLSGAVLHPADGGSMIRLTDDDAPWGIAALAARRLAREAGGGLRTCGTDRRGGMVITAPIGAGGVVLGLGDDRLRTLSQVRLRLRRAAARAAALTIEHMMDSVTESASVVTRNGTVYGDGGVVVARVDWKSDGSVITILGPDRAVHDLRPGDTEPVDRRDADEVVRPVIAQVRAHLTEYGYYL